MKQNPKIENRRAESDHRNLQRRISFFCFLFAVCSVTPVIPQPDKLHQTLLDATYGFTLMSVAAHPDDENIETVTYYRKKYGARAVVVVASRGEGGQNEIGPELYEDLGVVRSEEMRRAEAISGSEYFNLNFVDFGFSKHKEETYQKWGQEEIRRRLVRMIRLLKPHVIITNHDSQSGHSNHQAIGSELLTAFAAAADPKIFPEQRAEGLTVWQPLRLYRSTRDSAESDARIPVGEFSPELGKTYSRHAAEALSQHRSQGMHFFAEQIPDGPRWLYYRLIASAPGVPPLRPPGAAHSILVDDLFAGLENPWRGFSFSKKAQAVLDKLSEQANSLSPDRQTTLDFACDWVDELNREKVSLPEHLVSRSYELLATALGVDFSILSLQHTLVAGERANLAWSWTWDGFGGPTPTSGRPGLLKVFGTGYRIYVGENVVAKSDEPAPLPESGDVINFAASPRLPQDQPLTRPLTKIIYQAARLPEPVWGESFFTYRGARFILRRIASSPEGIPEIAAPLELEEPRMPIIVTSGDINKTVQVPVQLKHHPATFQPVEIILKNENGIIAQKDVIVEKDTVVSMALSIGAALPVSPWTLIAEAKTPNMRQAISVSYKAVPINLNIPEVRVGLIKSYDTTLEWALRAVNIPVAELSDADLAAGNFHDVQTIIVDMRAYLARPALRENNDKLLDWIKAGGHAVVMYHKTFDWNPRAGAEAPDEKKYFSPYLLHLGFERVTDETAKITMPDPQALFWQSPNQIAENDWKDWVQERGLYFPRRWDEHFTPLIRVADPGEAALDGGMLLGNYGEGSYLYTSLVWYRQLRAGVPGAFRVFMNMLMPRTASQP
jgi:LmbE family N-acetylglucosaminyl deacetylase